MNDIDVHDIDVNDIGAHGIDVNDIGVRDIEEVLILMILCVIMMYSSSLAITL